MRTETFKQRSRMKRLDRVLVDRGLVESRKKAQALILSGAVEIEGRAAAKAGMPVDDRTGIRIRGEGAGTAVRYVSRGGVKLAAAIAHFGMEVSGKVAADVGASTGGFTDCLLRHGAACVYAIDVGYGQLAWPLRQDPRVIVIERTNIRFLPPHRVPEPVDLATVDVAFISLTKVLPKVIELLGPHGMIIALVKPQFEVGKGAVGRGGIVRDPGKRDRALNGVIHFAETMGLVCRGAILSPIRGDKGNVEYLIHLVRS